MKHPAIFALVAAIPISLPFFLACTDPVLDQGIAALGPEPASPGPGPDHRPGQPCVLCHSEFGTAEGAFSVGGTIYETALPNSPPAGGATVAMRAADNSEFTATTTPAGNFFVRKDQWDPPFPIIVSVWKAGVGRRVMYSHIGREPSCAGCHFNPPDAGTAPDGRPLVHYKSFQAVGQVYLR